MLITQSDADGSATHALRWLDNGDGDVSYGKGCVPVAGETSLLKGTTGDVPAARRTEAFATENLGCTKVPLCQTSPEGEVSLICQWRKRALLVRHVIFYAYCNRTHRFQHNI